MTNVNNYCDNECKGSFDKASLSLLESMPKAIYNDDNPYETDTMMLAHSTVRATVRTATTHLMVHFGRGFIHAHIVAELMRVHMKFSTSACVDQP